MRAQAAAARAQTVDQAELAEIPANHRAALVRAAQLVGRGAAQSVHVSGRVPRGAQGRQALDDIAARLAERYRLECERSVQEGAYRVRFTRPGMSIS